MEDLDRNHQVDVDDAKYLYDRIDEMLLMKQFQRFEGGMGFYPGTRRIRRSCTSTSAAPEHAGMNSACGHASGRKREARRAREASTSGDSLEPDAWGWGPTRAKDVSPRESEKR
jgi:hypothetical protein